MPCSLCNHDSDHVIRSRAVDGQVQRVRQCDRCGHRWKTVELPVMEIKKVDRIVAAFKKLKDEIESVL